MLISLQHPDFPLLSKLYIFKVVQNMERLWVHCQKWGNNQSECRHHKLLKTLKQNSLWVHWLSQETGVFIAFICRATNILKLCVQNIGDEAPSSIRRYSFKNWLFRNTQDGIVNLQIICMMDELVSSEW